MTALVMMEGACVGDGGGSAAMEGALAASARGIQWRF